MKRRRSGEDYVQLCKGIIIALFFLALIMGAFYGCYHVFLDVVEGVTRAVKSGLE